MTKTQLVSKDFFTSLPYWDRLERDEQADVERETKGLAAAFAGHVMTRTAMGEHLANLQTLLEGKRLFRTHLEQLHFSYRTAYRYIEAFKAVKERVPDYALRLAAARGIDLVGYHAKEPFGPYTNIMKRLPPPTIEAKVPEWLDKLEEEKARQPRRRSRGRSVDPDARMKSAFRSCLNQFSKMDTGRERTRWAQRLIGCLLAEFNLPAARYEPEAAPEGFHPVLGRPKKQSVD